MKFKLVEDWDRLKTIKPLLEVKNENQLIKGIVFTASLNNIEPFVDFTHSFKITRLNNDLYHVYMILRNDFSRTHSSLDEWLSKNKIECTINSYYTISFIDESVGIELNISKDEDYLDYGDQLYEAAQIFYDYLD